MTPDEMRAQAKAWVVAAKQKLDEAALSATERVQVDVITDQVNAFTLVTLADVIENLNPDTKKAKAKRIVEYSDQIRKAAAIGYSKDDWSEFDKLVNAGIPNGGDSGANSGT